MTYIYMYISSSHIYVRELAHCLLLERPERQHPCERLLGREGVDHLAERLALLWRPPELLGERGERHVVHEVLRELRVRVQHQLPEPLEDDTEMIEV